MKQILDKMCKNFENFEKCPIKGECLHIGKYKLFHLTGHFSNIPKIIDRKSQNLKNAQSSENASIYLYTSIIT